MRKIKNFKTFVLLASLAFSGLLLSGCNKASEVATTSTPVGQGTARETSSASRAGIHLMHVHGLAYSPDGSKILIPSHEGLAIFDGAGWSKADGPQHDYMGFSATKSAIYSSGHPAPGSSLVNPFGVIKSTDGGRAWQKLGLEGESDFHMLATGYESNAVYVVNSHQNSKMKQPGIYYTLNDGFSWQHALAQGLQADPASLAVHPSNPKIVAIGTDNGLYLSQDAGDTFQRIADGKIVAVFFDLNGKHLWLSSVDGQSGLIRFDWRSKEARNVMLPAMQKDAVGYIAQNPVRRNEYAIATFQRSVYVSQDEGKTWRQVAEKGTTL